MASVLARTGTASLCIAMLAASFAVSATASLRPDAQAVAAVFPPWWTPRAVFAAAAGGGEVMQAGAAPGVVLVRSYRAGLPARLRSAGALMVLDPAFAGGCLGAREIKSG